MKFITLVPLILIIFINAFIDGQRIGHLDRRKLLKLIIGASLLASPGFGVIPIPLPFPVPFAIEAVKPPILHPYPAHIGGEYGGFAGGFHGGFGR